jgi:hypothetical protein
LSEKPKDKRFSSDPNLKVGGSSSRIMEALSEEPKENTRREDEELDDPKLKVGIAGKLPLTGSARGEGIVGVGGGSENAVFTAGTGNVKPKPTVSEFCFVVVALILKVPSPYKIQNSKSQLLFCK